MRPRRQKLKKTFPVFTYPEKNTRDFHNLMERVRRGDLRRHLERIKKQIPDLQQSERASKLSVLKKATAYVRDLGLQHSELIRIQRQEKEKNALLTQKLNNLMKAKSI